MFKAARPTRRTFLTGLLVGGAALLTACGTDPTLANPAPNVQPQLPVTAPGALEAPAVSRVSGPVQGVGSLKSATPRALATATGRTMPTRVFSSTTAATGTPTPGPTDTPAATATPTATPIPYDAARLTDVLGESITSYAGSV